MKKQSIFLLACSLFLAGCGENASSSGNATSSEPPISSDVAIRGIELKRDLKDITNR